MTINHLQCDIVEDGIYMYIQECQGTKDQRDLQAYMYLIFSTVWYWNYINKPIATADVRFVRVCTGPTEKNDLFENF